MFLLIFSSIKGDVDIFSDFKDAKSVVIAAAFRWSAPVHSFCLIPKSVFTTPIVRMRCPSGLENIVLPDEGLPHRFLNRRPVHIDIMYQPVLLVITQPGAVCQIKNIWLYEITAAAQNGEFYVQIHISIDVISGTAVCLKTETFSYKIDIAVLQDMPWTQQVQFNYNVTKYLLLSYFLLPIPERSSSQLLINKPSRNRYVFRSSCNG